MYYVYIKVDGDTDSPSVQREFEKMIREHIQKFSGQNKSTIENSKRGGNSNDDTTVIQDLEDVTSSVIPTISHHVSLTNGHLRPHANNVTSSANKKPPINGHIPNGRASFRNMLDEAENFPIDSHM